MGVLFGLLFLRVPVWLALAMIGIGGNVILSNVSVAQFIAGSTAFDMSSKYGLSVIPMFILMGEILLRSEELRDALWDVCDAKLEENEAEVVTPSQAEQCR